MVELPGMTGQSRNVASLLHADMYAWVSALNAAGVWVGLGSLIGLFVLD